MLIPDEFLLFFEVFYDLPEGLFQDLDLALEDLNLLLLDFASLVILINGS